MINKKNKNKKTNINDKQKKNKNKKINFKKMTKS